MRINVLSQVHARTRDCEQRGVRRARTAVSAEGPKRRSKEFWVLSLPVLPGYRSGALANLREEAPSHTASLGRVAPPSPSGSHNLRCMIIYSRRLPGARVRGERGKVCAPAQNTHKGGTNADTIFL